MPYIDATVQHEAEVGVPLSLGSTDIEPGSVANLDGLAEGTDYQVDYAAGTVTLLADDLPAHVHFRLRMLEVDTLAPVRAVIEAIRATGYDADADRLDQLAAAITGLRQYVGLASPTLVQSGQALKVLIRVVLFMLKRQGY